MVLPMRPIPMRTRWRQNGNLCNLCKSAPRGKINMRRLVKLPDVPYKDVVAPLGAAPFVMAGGASAVGQ